MIPAGDPSFPSAKLIKFQLLLGLNSILEQIPPSKHWICSFWGGLPARGAGGGPRAGARGCLRGPAPWPDAAVAGGAEGQTVKWGDRLRQTGRQVARYPGR